MEEFEDDTLQVMLELEAYEREKRRKAIEQMIEHMTKQINISDEEQQVIAMDTTMEHQLESQMNQPETTRVVAYNMYGEWSEGEDT